MSKIDKTINVYVKQLEARSKASVKAYQDFRELADAVESGKYTAEQAAQLIRFLAEPLAPATKEQPEPEASWREYKMRAIRNAAGRGMNFHVFCTEDGKRVWHTSWQSLGTAQATARKLVAGRIFNSDGFEIVKP